MKRNIIFAILIVIAAIYVILRLNRELRKAGEDEEEI